ncbi:MAG: DMT family transporter [Pseudomonadota bacterium]
MRKDRMDAAGAAGLIVFGVLLAFNQVVIKVTNEGFQPIFFAGVRSVGALVCVYLWLRWRGRSLEFPPDATKGGILIGLCFTVEFVCLFLALDYTTVSRSVVIFYSMPVWLALAAHFLIPGERLTWLKTAGLALAFLGVIVAIGVRDDGDTGTSLLGDFLALGAALAWAGIALCARATGLEKVSPEMQLIWQLGVSAPLLLLLSPLFGPYVRDLAPIHWAGLVFQVGVVASGGFLFWLWLISIYPAGAVASFAFLTPVFGVIMGWALLGETLGPSIFAALFLVASGLILINWRRS